MRLLAKSRNGLCLSDIYIDSRTPLKWQCIKGHIWLSMPSHITNGTWCPDCAGTKRLKIEDVKIIAKHNNGKCLSKEYKNAHQKLNWECQVGHTWYANYNSVQRGSWCPHCAGNSPYSIEDVKKIAISRGGICLSDEYSDRKKKLKWQCAFGHEWDSVVSGIVAGRWCPECSSGRGERICRAYFEAIFDKKFIKAKPKWLRNKVTGRLLELDGYCEELGIAFEHQGEQHYSECTGIFKDQFEKISNRDNIKKKLCKDNNVILIEIPEIGELIKLDKVENAIKEIIFKYGIKIEERSLNINIKDFYVKNDDEFLNKLKKAVTDKNGKLLSNKYVGAREKYLIECSCKFQWKTTPYNIYKGQWCPRCAKEIRARSRRVKIICVDNNTIYDSIKEAAEKLNITRGSIYHVLVGSSKTAGGLRFKYLNP